MTELDRELEKEIGKPYGEWGSKILVFEFLRWKGTTDPLMKREVIKMESELGRRGLLDKKLRELF